MKFYAKRVWVSTKWGSCWMWELSLRGSPSTTPAIYPTLNRLMDRVYMRLRRVK